MAPITHVEHSLLCLVNDEDLLYLMILPSKGLFLPFCVLYNRYNKTSHSPHFTVDHTIDKFQVKKA